MDKRGVESEHFKYFRKLIPSFPEGEVWHEDAPDFLIHAEKGLIGIEHRQLFQESPTGERPLQAREHEIDNILVVAKEHAELRGMPPVHVTFIFRGGQNNTRGLDKQTRLNLGREITKAVNKNLPQENESVKITYPDTGKRGFPEEITHVFLNRYGKQHKWTYCEAVESLFDCRGVLQQAIDAKANKLLSYKNTRHLTECWLLIVANGLRHSGSFAINEPERNHTYSSPFDRTYFLNYSDPQPLFCLKTKNDV